MDYYQNLYFALDQLIESGEDADVVFDAIIDHLAYRAEEAQRKAEGFRGLLNLTRNENPVETIPDALYDEDALGAVHEAPAKPNWEDIYGGMSDINKQFMSRSPDDFLDFIRDIKFKD